MNHNMFEDHEYSPADVTGCCPQKAEPGKSDSAAFQHAPHHEEDLVKQPAQDDDSSICSLDTERVPNPYPKLAQIDYSALVDKVQEPDKLATTDATYQNLIDFGMLHL